MKHLTIVNPTSIGSLWQNERGLEEALIKDFILNKENLIEVGAVSPYYIPGITHTIIDPMDDYPNCLRLDGEFFDYTNKNVMCISTCEHMGTTDYAMCDIDQEKPMRFIKKLWNEADKLLITWPIGSNSYLDNWFQMNSGEFQYTIYNRVIFNPPIWVRSEDLSLLKSVKYNEPFPNGNAIVVIYK